MLPYKTNLKHNARWLRKEMTDSERLLWSKLRRKQVLNIQFYRQKPIGDYIVDFYAPKVNLVVEVDGSQHMEPDQEKKDRRRDIYLRNKGLYILRFNNLEVLKELPSVMEVIYQTVKERISIKSPSTPPLLKGDDISSLIKNPPLCKRGVRGHVPPS